MQVRLFGQVERDALSFKFEYSVSDTMSWRGATVRETDSLWRVATIYGDTINLDTTKYAGELIWSSREDLAGYDGDVLFRLDVSDGWDRHPFASRYALNSDNQTGVMDTNFAIIEVYLDHYL